MDLAVHVGSDRRWSGLEEAAVKLLLLRTGRGGLERRTTTRLTARNRDNNEVRSQIRRRLLFYHHRHLPFSLGRRRHAVDVAKSGQLCFGGEARGHALSQRAVRPVFRLALTYAYQN